MRNRLPAAAVGLAAAVWSAPAAAQLSAQGGPILISADVNELFEKERRVVYEGDVDVVQGDARLQADRIDVRYEAGRSSGAGSGVANFGDLDTITATGNVFYVTPDLSARGDRAIYDASEETIRLEKNVVLLRGQDVAKGDLLVLRVEAGLSSLEAAEGGRVRMTIQPETAPDPESSR